MAEIGTDGSILVEDHSRPPRRIPLHAGHERRRHPWPRRAPRLGQGAGARACRPRFRARRRRRRCNCLEAQRPHRLARVGDCQARAWRRPAQAKDPAPADEHLGLAEREQISRRIEAWLASQLDGRLKPLVALSEASDLSGLARGLAFRLAETLGVLRRDAVSSEVKELDQGARAAAPRLWRALRRLQHLHAGAAQACRSRPLASALGAPRRAQLRPRRRCPAAPSAARPHLGRGRCENPRALLARRWLPGRRRTRHPHRHAGEAVRPHPRPRVVAAGRGRRVARRRAPPATAAFARRPELMSVVGCSGEDFASILKALGFRRERRELAEAESSGRVEATEATRSRGGRGRNRVAGSVRARLRRNPAPRQAQGRRASPTTLRRGPSRSGGASGTQAPRQREPRPPRVERKERPRAPDSSPFAVLAELAPQSRRPPSRGQLTLAPMSGQRLDKWLWCARLVKTRTLAARLIEAGKVRINGVRTQKVSRSVRAGDVVTGITAGAGRLFVVRVAGEAERRGPAAVARTLDEDLTPVTPAPISNVAREWTPPDQARPQAARRHQGRRCIDCLLRSAPPPSLEPSLVRPAPLGMACLVLGARLG